MKKFRQYLILMLLTTIFIGAAAVSPPECVRRPEGGCHGRGCDLWEDHGSDG